jgi:hypothetical protein
MKLEQKDKSESLVDFRGKLKMGMLGKLKKTKKEL